MNRDIQSWEAQIKEAHKKLPSCYYASVLAKGDVMLKAALALLEDYDRSSHGLVKYFMTDDKERQPRRRKVR